MLTVEDDGKGVPDEARDKVFKAFTRIDDSRNRETGGYGLGLAVVARVAELHGGTGKRRRVTCSRRRALLSAVAGSQKFKLEVK